MNNIDVFNIAVGEIFRECYASFPIPTTISKGVIGHSVVEISRGYEQDVYNHDDIEFEIVYSTILWLVRAGYIWLSKEPEKSDRTFDAVLSPKGLEVLNAVPASVSGSGTIGQRLTKGAKELGLDVFKNLSIQALSVGASIAFNGASA